MTRTSTTLGDLLAAYGGSVKTGPFGTVLQASEYSSKGVPIISVGEIGYGTLQVRPSTPRAGAEITARLPEYVLSAGDIVFARKGAVDRSSWVRKDQDGWFLGSDGIRLRLPSGVNSRFIAYQFRSAPAREWLVQHAGGTTMASLNQRILERVPLTLPRLSDQRAIATVLGALDDKIAANTNLARSADDYLAALLHGFLLRGQYGTVRLADIATVNARVAKPVEGGTLRYVDIASVAVGCFAYPDRMSWSDAPSRARRRIRKGDTLWSTVRPNRRSHALVLSGDAELVGSTGLAVLTPQATGFAYLYEVTRRSEFTGFLESAADGSAYPAVRPERFGDAPVPLLNGSEMNAFEDIAAPVRVSAASLDDENRTLASTRDALLPHLMSGKLRVKDAEKIVSETV